MDELLKGKIEAVLFITGRALTIGEIAEKLGETSDTIEFALLELITDYATRQDSALEIDDSDGYILQVKDVYSEIVNKMIPIELSIGAVRTLSAIALHGPMLQSDLIEARGSSAYDHIKELLQYKLVSKKRKERSYVLNTTPRFQEYFKLTGDKDELKSAIANLRDDAAEEAVLSEEILAEEVFEATS